MFWLDKIKFCQLWFLYCKSNEQFKNYIFFIVYSFKKWKWLVFFFSLQLLSKNKKALTLMKSKKVFIYIPGLIVEVVAGVAVVVVDNMREFSCSNSWKVLWMKCKISFRYVSKVGRTGVGLTTLILFLGKENNI